MNQSLPLHLGAAAFFPRVGASAVELFGACSNRDISEQESKPVLSPLPAKTSSSHWWKNSPFPVCQIQPCHVPILCLAIPQPLSSSQLFHPAALPAPCSALELPNPGLARWAAAAQTLWGFLLQPVQPLSLLLCYRMGPPDEQREWQILEDSCSPVCACPWQQREDGGMLQAQFK